MEESSKQTIKGLNDGYILMKYNKDLAIKLGKSFREDSPYIEGFNKGIKEASLEKDINKMKSKHFDISRIQSQLKSKEKNKDKDLDKDK